MEKDDKKEVSRNTTYELYLMDNDRLRKDGPMLVKKYDNVTDINDLMLRVSADDDSMFLRFIGYDDDKMPFSISNGIINDCRQNARLVKEFITTLLLDIFFEEIASYILDYACACTAAVDEFTSASLPYFYKHISSPDRFLLDLHNAEVASLYSCAIVCPDEISYHLIKRICDAMRFNYHY
jgi:hypothetical protein